MKRSLGVIAASLMLLPVSGFAASREQQEMQRDIAQLQDQVRMLQSTVDQKFSAMQTLIEQALEAGNKANTSVSVLSSTVTQTLDRELKDSLRPVAGVSARVENLANDVAEVKSSVTELNSQMNRLMQTLNDVNNAVKTMQAPTPPPPSSTNSAGLPGAAGAPAAQAAAPPAKALFENAMSDYSSGKSDLAATEFNDFIRYYSDDPNAPAAQFFIGQIHNAQQKYDQAAQDFDAVLERYPENKYTPDALFMKGMALKLAQHRDAAAVEFRNLLRKYPRSDRAQQANEQLRAMGLSPTGGASAPATAKRRK